MIRRISGEVNKFYLFQKYPIAKEFIKFCLVGLTNLAIDMSGYWIFTRIFHIYYILAAVFSFFIAVSWSFLINRRWTFRHDGKNIKEQYVKFIVANLISMAINLSLLYILVDYAGFHDLGAKLLTAFMVAFFNFSLNKSWTFRKNSAIKPEG
ncbi:GtrA family protein [Candidatus Falkowbacteria bacterium]|nr:GtrA family protein [Candidatus Falkowbacteria bacterium]